MELTTISEKPQVKSLPEAHFADRGAFLTVLASAAATTAAEICLKLGAAETAARPSILPWLGFSGLESKWVWGGIVLTIFSFVLWIRAIRAIPLSLAFTCSNVVHVFMPLGCWLILGEEISPRRWLGIALVILGLLVIARPFATLNEKLDEAL